MVKFRNKWKTTKNTINIVIISNQLMIIICVLIWSSLTFCSAIISSTNSPKKGCDKERKIYGINNETYGVISDGPKDYPMDSHCEWLITTQHNNNHKTQTHRKYITLTFIEIETECSYDHIYVFDGSSYESDLLGSFSGKTLPIPVTATSGSMLILLYSDTNYVLQGFVAQYSITDCPMNCSGHGLCLNNQCICDKFWTDIACDLQLCPHNCSENGICIYDTSNPLNSYCNCSQGFAGESCSYTLFDDNLDYISHNNSYNINNSYDSYNNSDNFDGFDSNNTQIENEWHLLSSNKYIFPSRAGHASVYSPDTDSIYTFGGRNFDLVFGDLFQFDFKSNKWTNLTLRAITNNSSSLHPKGVWGHQMVYFDNSIVMFGGIFSNGILSNELWSYDISQNEWQLKAINSTKSVPTIALHSLTLVENQWLYAFGGRLEDGSFSSNIYRINILEGLKDWERVEPIGGKALDRRLAGHTALYDETTKSILVYGGVSVDYARFSRLSGQLHAFHVEKRIWTRLRFSAGEDSFGISPVPLERAFHSAIIIKNSYLLIYGGYTHRHSREEVCYDNSFYLYSLKCHKWISFKKLTEDSHNVTARDGVFSHTFLMRNNTALILGGYSGTVRNQLWAYVLPQVITSIDPHICGVHRKRANCLSNPLCGWCERSEEAFCLHGSRQSQCSTSGASFTSETCPGVCPLLPDCYSCLAWNQYNTSCLWCVGSAQCYQQNHNKSIPYSCRTKRSSSVSSMNSRSHHAWWGSHPIILKGSLSECQYRNFRPGLTMLKYRYPSNWSQPDEVMIINQTLEHVIFHQEFSGERESQSDSAVNVARILGYIHPLGAQPLSENYLRLFMGSSGSQAILKVSSDSSESSLELSANHTSTSYIRTEAHRTDNSRIFSETSINDKFLIDFIVNIPIKSATTFTEPDTMQLVWNAYPVYREVLSYEFLEPFRNDSQCKTLGNCLSCLSNSGCGWCESTNTCMIRIQSNQTDSTGSIDSNCYNSDGEQQYLVLESSHCELCSDFIYCKNCAFVPHCEWLVEEAHCVRRGRYEDAVRHPNMCPLDCHERRSCASCLGDPGRCAWCQQTNTCFLFSTYTTSFMFGGCQEWIDEDHHTHHHSHLHSHHTTETLPSKTSQTNFQWCRDCTKHTTCMSCLSDLRCGWCSLTINPMIGLCAEGDFHKPNLNCETAINSKFGNSSQLGGNQSVWDYHSCPDVDECQLDLHNCHANATCRNTPTSFSCTCNSGHKGDGVTSCLRTCDVQCIHGYCSESPQYYCICELGWTGIDCSTNCLCNNHSTCAKGVAICDKCEDWTEGEFCEICSKGSFGNATNSLSCQKCSCNGHGDPSRGLCDPNTGHCFCTDNTEGINCERCKSGYFGDPRNNGKCYLECLSRGLIFDARNGSFGSKAGYIATGSSLQMYCLWIFTIHKTLDASSLYSLTRSPNSITTPLSIPIALTIERNMKVKCPDSNIQVYDGVPDFVASGALRKKLGYYCGTDLERDIHLVAYSGFLTVFFERHDPNQGFNASFVRLDCSHSCSSLNNSECLNNWCNCSECQTHRTNACPNNCSAEQNQGSCDLMNGRCVCMPKFGDKDCSLALTPNRLVWSTLFNSEAVSPFLPSLAIYLPRMGHSLDSSETALWLFGGYSSIRGQVADMFRFDLISSRWEEIKTPTRKRDGQPQARHFHATALIGDYIYLYGGLSQVNGVLSDFWCFKTSEQTWTKLATISDIPALAGHTLTAFDNKLLLIGGYSSSYGFLEKQFEYDVTEHEWKVWSTSGASPTGIYGHSAVYHSQSSSIYVYGGIAYDVDRTIISGHLYALYLTTKVWYRLPSDEQINPIDFRPKARYFHASVSTEFYMIIIGGRNNESNIITHNSLYAYIYKCNKWMSLEMDSILISGESPSPAVGLSATLQENNLYIFGGSNGQTLGNLVRLSLPKDLCQLFSHSRLGCLRHIGCSYCAVYENGVNRTFCYSQDSSIPSSCYNPKGASEVAQGIACGADLLERRNCYQYNDCTDCVAVWPIYSSIRQVCQWCSNCQQGRCIPSGASCERETECNLPQRVVTQPHLCPLMSCLASDCEKCTAMSSCMWTRQVLRSSELGHTLNVKPIFDWTCVRKILQDASSFPVESMPPLSCPPRCHQYMNCSTCLESAGGEGGWHECAWAQTAQHCMSPSFVGLTCEAGLCGALVLQGSRAQCPISCNQLKQSAHCLSKPQCGWCAFNGSRVDGRGICMEGGLFGPNGGICTTGQVVVFGQQLPSDVNQWFAQSDGHPKWAYLEKPKENECLNGHHTCDERHEECVDLEDGFMCRCKPGYIIEGNQCKPTCNQGCIFGTCIAPDVCQCNFGYIGVDCSLACECNGHSNCAGINRLSDCLECQNHTQGLQCQKCKPFFVGNPINSGKCISCKTYCNSHTEICLSPDLINSSSSSLLNTMTSMEDLSDIVEEGPVSEAICLNCQHNTHGDRCDSCIPGFFKSTDNIRDGCRPCHCHRHGDMCSPLNGENCNCHNNTENDRQCNQKNSKNLMTPCWQLQCSKCKEYFLGVPTNGHQCYRHMFLDKDYCLDPSTQEECSRTPNKLLFGRTVFFAVQPRYMNVDIRIVVDVTKGGVDFFLSSKEDTFVIDVNKTTGIHYVWLDKKYSSDINSNTGDDWDSLLLKKEFLFNDSSYGISSSQMMNSSPLSSAQHTGPALKLRHHSAHDLLHYLTITDPNEFLVIRNLQNRLVITIPQEVHDLRSTRFYMVLRGIGSTNTMHTYGNLFFRQDQSRIDLFVFFSVFFSCFFLFLAACVLVWKVKQAFDMRRARRLHAAEMKNMASRPFSAILCHIDSHSDPDDFEFALSSPTHHLQTNVKKGRGFRFKGSHSSLKDSPKAQVYPEIIDKYLIRPVAVEPTSDGHACVVTTLVQLPGGSTAPIRMSLASTLVSVRGSHHILNANHHYSSNNVSSVGAGVWMRAAMRRRTHIQF